MNISNILHLLLFEQGICVVISRLFRILAERTHSGVRVASPRRNTAAVFGILTKVARLSFSFASVVP